MMTSVPAYEAMCYGGMVQLPHPRTVEKHNGKASSETGHSQKRYEEIGKVAGEKLSEQDRQTCAIIFDEINVAGELMFKIINGEYCFYGLVSEEIRARLYAAQGDVSVEEQLKAKQATHALVFQVTSIGGAKFRRVCGVHPVRGLNATMLDQLFWDTTSTAYT